MSSQGLEEGGLTLSCQCVPPSVLKGCGPAGMNLLTANCAQVCFRMHCPARHHTSLLTVHATDCARLSCCCLPAGMHWASSMQTCVWGLLGMGLRQLHQLPRCLSLSAHTVQCRVYSRHCYNPAGMDLCLCYSLTPRVVPCSKRPASHALVF